MADPEELWQYGPVLCEGCTCVRTPVMTEYGWRMPVHQLTRSTWPAGVGLCHGSLAAVDV